MILSDIELKAEIEAGRIVFDPPLASSRFQSASIDLALHSTFWKSNLPAGDGIDITIELGKANPYSYLDRFETDEVLLKPGDLVLGETAEAVTIPQHLCGWIEGKSGLARHGLIVHCTAPHIAPGWGQAGAKRITLEIVNHGSVNVLLRPGMGIAQLIFMRLGSPSLVMYSGKHSAAGT